MLLSSFFFSGCSLTAQKKSGLQVITNDVPSSVFLNDQFLEKTPYIGKNFQPGQYTLRIQPDNPELVPYETSITLRKGLLSVVTWKPGKRPETSGGVIYEMEKSVGSRKTEMFITSLPDGAIVRLDNQPKDFTPLIVENIEPGHHEFEVSLPSYETQKHTINAIEGHRMNVTVKLAKIDPTQTTNQESDQNQTTTQSAQTTQSKIKQSTQTATSSGTPLRSAKESSTSTNEEIEPPYVEILTTNFYQDGEEVLRVRASASSAGKELGFALVGNMYPYLDDQQNGWYKIEFEDQEGWVSNKYSSLEK